MSEVRTFLEAEIETRGGTSGRVRGALLTIKPLKVKDGRVRLIAVIVMRNGTIYQRELSRVRLTHRLIRVAYRDVEDWTGPEATPLLDFSQAKPFTLTPAQPRKRQ